MKRLIQRSLSLAAAGLLLGLGAPAIAGQDGMHGMDRTERLNRTTELSGELRYSVYDLNRQHQEAARMTGQMGQAGRAGPEEIPGGRLHQLYMGDTRNSIYDEQHERKTW
ncbi:hypothetical protein [Azoarcus olearius]|nr:hypothetical protein [Azoarcus olearius]ANQ86952.1 hypothetical protein dqs_3936 [Azoarcus olearius]